MPLLPLVVTCLTLAAPPADSPPKFVEVDYTRIERRLVKEPRYNAAPRYALFLFDPQAKFRVWAVLDKSKPDGPDYDVLYFDVNGDGDITDPKERFVGSFNEKTQQFLIPVGKLPVPGTSLIHTDLKFCTRESHGYKGIWFSMKWNGEVPVEGGYRGFGTDLTAYAASPEKAPVLRPTPLGPLGFTVCDEVVLPAGGARDVQFLVGNPGSGPDTLCALSEHFLKPGKDRLFATVIARDAHGKQLLARTEITRHC